MRKKIKSILLGLATVAIAVTVIFAVVKAGDITPPSGTPTATFYTLSEIYEFIVNNTAATEGTHDFTFSDALTGTSHTLTEIYNVLNNLISADKVKLGTTYLNVAGTLTPDGGTAGVADLFDGKTSHLTDDWSLDTGTLDLACNTAIFDATANLVATAYDGTGDGTNRWCMTTSTNAASVSEIISGYRAWVNGQEITGTAASAVYTWTKEGSGSWEGINEGLDWEKEIGGTGWWNSITYTYCAGATTCTNISDSATLQGAASYAGPPGGWNGSNDFTNFNNSALQAYEVITSDSTGLGDCTADTGDLVFPDGSVWDKSAANSYSTTLTGCDVDDSNASSIWSAAGGSGKQYGYAKNVPSALSIADAWDGRKNLTSGINGTHSYTQDGQNNDYYDRTSVSWYYDAGDGAGTSRLAMVEEYERARQGTEESSTSLLYGTTNWSQYQWTAEPRPDYTGVARVFLLSLGYAYYFDVNKQTGRLWIVVAQ